MVADTDIIQSLFQLIWHAELNTNFLILENILHDYLSQNLDMVT